MQGRVGNWLQSNGIEASVRELVSKVETVDFAATPKGGENPPTSGQQRSLVAVSSARHNHECHNPDSLGIPPSDAVDALRDYVVRAYLARREQLLCRLLQESDS